MALKSATTTLATIQMRRGAEENFDPDQMTAGEWAVSTDSKKVWMCFMPGLVLRMATYEAFEKDMEEIRAILVEAQDIQLAIQTWYKLAESYAHGGTGAREGEETDNAKYYSEQAKASADKAESLADIGIMTTEKAGIGKPDGTTITVDADGTMHSVGGENVDIATAEKAGIVKPDGTTITITEDGTISAAGGADGDFASKAIYGDNAISMGRESGSVIGSSSIAFGERVIASNTRSMAFGNQSKSLGDNSFSCGAKTTASGESSFCEGRGGTASGTRSHAEGHSTTASGDYSHAEGYSTTASGDRSHAGGSSCVASGYSSHAEGSGTTASGDCSHAEGFLNKSIGKYSHTEGSGTTADGYYSHAEGSGTTAYGYFDSTTEFTGPCHAEGYGTKAKMYQHAQGTYNDDAKCLSNSLGASSSTAFVIGNGTPTIRSNAARIDYNGKLWCKQAYSSTGADYAELFEWADGNPDNEDRRGYFVTVEGKKIKKAQAGDYILGIISGNPSVIGNTDMEWYGQFMRDEFGTFIKENYKETVKEPVVDEEGNVSEVEKEVDVEFYRVNPDYDPDAPYIFRLDRPEWDAVGMVGVLPIRDDGTCEVGKFCKCADGGIATLSAERGFDTYMVIERVTENIVSVILK